jgi:hypothetical protein
MFAQNYGFQRLRPGKDRLRSGIGLLRTRGSNINIGTILRSFSLSGAMCVGRFCANVLMLAKGIPILAGAPILFSANSALAVPSYVQGNYAVPQTPQTTVTVPYAAAQLKGDLNVVIVGWNDSNATVSSVTDSQGNQYHLALGPTVLTGVLSQSIYYAPNISPAAASADAVTVTFKAAAQYPDIRILEYSGIDSVSPVDVSVGAAGTSATSSSGAATTTNPADLLVGANTVLHETAGASSGFTQRLLTEPDSDIAEDRVVNVAGTYITSEPLTSAAGWVAQMVAFRSASGSSSPTQTPTPTPAPTPTPSPSPSTSVTLAWNADAATGNSGTNPARYTLYIGTSSGNYTRTQAAGTATSVVVSGLNSGSTYYFAVAAYNAAGIDSPYSNEVVYTVP